MRVSSILSILFLAAPATSTVASPNVQRRRVTKIYKTTDERISKRALQPDQGGGGPGAAVGVEAVNASSSLSSSLSTSLSISMSLSLSSSMSSEMNVLSMSSSLSSSMSAGLNVISMSSSLSSSMSAEMTDISMTSTPTYSPTNGETAEKTDAPTTTAPSISVSVMSMSFSMPNETSPPTSSPSLSISMSYEVGTGVFVTMSPVMSAPVPTYPPTSVSVDTPAPFSEVGTVAGDITGITPVPTAAMVEEPAAATSGAMALGNGLAALAATVAFLL
ncbi:hypothetical protein ACHAXA_004605 [Cyclostephanos tholiformis]|uniref:Uncharacterized protein n=1 Tax=Cyclostephanos tholiformis TaxID=382380 RepID=A0ABD3SP49_9STRA